MAKARKKRSAVRAKTKRRPRKPPFRPKRSQHYNECKARWERSLEERKAQFAEAQAAGGKPDSRDDWKPGARFVAPDPIASGKSGGDWLIDQPELPLDAGPFLATLRILGYHLQDRRYIELHRELIYSDLIDWKTGKWSRFGITVANPFTQDMCGSIEESIAARGFTEREAIADAVAELGLEAASFEAAYKRVKRLLDEYRKAVGHRPA